MLRAILSFPKTPQDSLFISSDPPFQPKVQASDNQFMMFGNLFSFIDQENILCGAPFIFMAAIDLQEGGARETENQLDKNLSLFDMFGLFNILSSDEQEQRIMEVSYIIALSAASLIGTVFCQNKALRKIKKIEQAEKLKEAERERRIKELYPYQAELSEGLQVIENTTNAVVSGMIIANAQPVIDMKKILHKSRGMQGQRKGGLIGVGTAIGGGAAANMIRGAAETFWLTGALSI